MCVSTIPPLELAPSPSGLGQMLLILSGDVELNPGPENKSSGGKDGCGRANCKCSSVVKFAQQPAIAWDLPYLDVEGLSCEEEQEKRARLLREHKEVLFAFQNLISTTWKALKRNNHTPKSIAEYVEGLEAFYRSRNSEEQPVPIYKQYLEQLRAASDIQDVFIIIREHYSYYNHHVILEMMHSLGGHQTDRRREQMFLEKFNYYARRKVIECPKLYAMPSASGYCTMIVLVDRDPADTTLHEIESVRLRIGIQLKLARNSLRLIYIEKSGARRMIHAYQFPAFLHSMVFPLNSDQKSGLHKEKIVSLDCCDYKFSIAELGASIAEEAAPTTDKQAQKSSQGNQGQTATGSDVDPVPMEIAPPQRTLPPCNESDFQLGIDESTITQAHLHLAQPGFEGKNYVAYVQQPSDRALIASLLIREHIRKKRAVRALPKIMVVANTKPRAQELHTELEKILPKATIYLFTGTEENSMTTKLCLQQSTVIVCTAGKLYSEMESDVVHMSSFNLLIMDDSHLCRQQTPSESVIMHYVVKEKNYNSDRPDYIQIVGITESLCGRFPALQVKPMVNHLLDICGSVDAIHGICSVPDSLKTVPDSSSQPSTLPTDVNVHTFKYQDAKHDFIALISVQMGLLEEDNNLVCPYEKFSQEYKQFIKEKMKEYESGGLVKEGQVPAESVSKEVSQKLAVLELLWLYSEALSACNERGCEEGLAVLNRQEGSSLLSTSAQVELRRELEEVARRKDAVIETLNETVRHHLQNSNAKGILFVDTPEEAQRYCTEIKASIFQAHPGVITRKTALQYSTTSCINLTKEGEDPVISEEQKAVIESFNNGETRILVVPIAVETEADILNLPSCNFLLRLKHLENRYEMIDTEYIITSAHTSELKTSSELIKEIKMSLLKDALKQLPTGEAFKKALNPRQDELMYEYTGRYRSFFYRPRKRKKGPTIDMLQLRCKKCRVFVCHGTELFTFFVDGGQHYVVPNLDFRLRSTTKPYRSKHKTIKRVSRLQQMFCGNCCAKWGTLCLFPRKGCELPVLKSKNFVFEMDRKFYRIKMWSDALFYVPPVSACDKFTVYGEESSKLDD